MARLLARVAADPAAAVRPELRLDLRRLEAWPADACALLAPALDDPRPSVRAFAARRLRHLDRPRAAALLTPYLESEDLALVRDACGAAFGESPWEPARVREPPGTPPAALHARLVAAARRLVERGPGWAAPDARRWLGALGDPGLAEWVLARLPGRDLRHRISLYATLATAPRGLQHLVRLCRDADAETRGHALMVLGVEHVAEDRALVVETVVCALTDPVEAVRATATSRVGRLLLHEAEDGLLRAVEERADGAFARAELRALAELRSRRALPHLLAAARTAGDPQQAALHALAAYGPDTEIEAALHEVLAAAADPMAAWAAWKALADVGGPRSLPLVEAALAREIHRLDLARTYRRDIARALVAAAATWRAQRR